MDVSGGGAAAEITPVASGGGGDGDADGDEAGADDVASDSGGKRKRRRLKHAGVANQQQRQDAAARVLNYIVMRDTSEISQLLPFLAAKLTTECQTRPKHTSYDHSWNETIHNPSQTRSYDPVFPKHT